MTYEELKKANETIKTTDIKGKNYAEVNQRIKAFRMVYPEGFILPMMISNENGVCIFRAEVGYYKEHNTIADDDINKYQDTYMEKVILGTGTAYEKESSSFINKTSYIENCETSAVGRALGMCGFGIDVSVASAEEVENAILQQNADKKIDKTKIEALKKAFENSGLSAEQIEKGLKHYGYEKIEDITEKDYMKIYQNVTKEN